MTHFRAVAAASDLPIMVYNNPVSYTWTSPPRCSPSWPTSRSSWPSRNRRRTSGGSPTSRTLCGDRYMLFCGVDDLVLESMLLGAAGWVSGLVNAFPAENRLLWDLACQRPMGRGAGGLPLVHAALAPGHARQARAVHQAGRAGMRLRHGTGSPAAPALGRRGARADPGDHPPRHRHAAEAFQGRRGAWDLIDRKQLHRVQVIDSHTGGEPTRVVIAGGPDLGGGTDGRAAGRLSRASTTRFARPSSTSRAGRTCWSARCCCEPVDPACVGRRDLLQQRRLSGHVRPRHDRRGADPGPSGQNRPGRRTGLRLPSARSPSRSRTPKHVTFETSRATASAGRPVEFPACGAYHGDVAWGGNWFFLVEDHGETHRP